MIRPAYEMCGHDGCWFFVDENMSYDPDDFYGATLAPWIHLDDITDHDHDAEPSDDVRTMFAWQRDHPELFRTYEDGEIGPRSDFFLPLIQREI